MHVWPVHQRLRELLLLEVARGERLNHALMPLEEVVRLLGVFNPPRITSAQIAEAMEKGRKLANQAIIESRKSIVHPSELTLVLR